MRNKHFWKILWNIVLITAGSALYSVGMALLLDPNNLAPGGISGIAVILNRVTGVRVGTLYFSLNLPILLLGWAMLGGKVMLTTGIAVALNSVMTNFLGRFGPLTTDPLLASLSGGILLGVGIGLVFMGGATTGGTDIIVKIIRRKYKHVKTGRLFQLMDIAVVACAGIVFRDFNLAIYAFISVMVSGAVMDRVLYRGDEAQLTYIISSYPQRIADRILKEMETGVTYLQGTGAYSQQQKQVILCVVRKQMGPKLEEVVKQEDPAAFMILSSANEIYGEGYKDIFAEKL